MRWTLLLRPRYSCDTPKVITCPTNIRTAASVCPSPYVAVTTAAITKTGILQKSTLAQSDFTHELVSSGQSVGVASYTLNLDDYIGKKVSVTGQFSGDTLYADTITVIP